MESFCAKCAKGVVLFILACAAAAAAALALGLALLALALVIVLLLAALILNPTGVRALMRQAAGKIDDWMQVLEKFAQSMKDVLSSLSEAAQAAAGTSSAAGAQGRDAVQGKDAASPNPQKQKLE